MTITAFDDYIEKMRTECPDTIQTLNTMAISLDGGSGSLQYKFTGETFKSCDYMRLKGKNLYIIEFSHFLKQIEDLRVEENQRNLARNQPSSPNKHYKKINPSTYDVIYNEIIEKFKDTAYMINVLMPKKINLRNNYKRELKGIVSICIEKKSDVMVLHPIQRRIKVKLDRIFKDMSFVAHNRVAQELKF